MTQPRWLPRHFTKPLRDDFISDGPRLREFAARFCRDENGKPLVLAEWQAWFIDRALERYPDDWHDEELAGQLRFKFVLLSVARGNGKSEIAKVLGFYGLMLHHRNPLVVGLASNAQQAGIIYKRVKTDIDANPALKRRFKATGTRGITGTVKPGFYTTMAAKDSSLQGWQLTMCLFDEVHICQPELWSAMVAGSRSRGGIVIGLTTAGDDTSLLLKDLYRQGQDAVQETESRFGFFCWEAPKDAKVTDPEALLDANPSVACGLQSMADLLTIVKGQPEDDARRYNLNLFVSGSDQAWLPMHLWHSAEGEFVNGEVVFSVDQTPMAEHATITATTKVDGVYYTQVVASIVKPSLDKLTEVCERLGEAHNPKTFVMDGYMLKDLGSRLRASNWPVKVLTLTDVTSACRTAYALLAAGSVRHSADPLLAQQMPHAIRATKGDAWRISRASSAHDIDAVLSTVFGIYAADVVEDAGLGIY